MCGMFEPLHIYGCFYVIFLRENLGEFNMYLLYGCTNPCCVGRLLNKQRCPCLNLGNLEYIDKFKESLKTQLNKKS